MTLASETLPSLSLTRLKSPVKRMGMDIPSQDPQGWIDLGHVCIHEGKPRAASEAFLRAVRVLIRAKELVRAQEVLDLATALAPTAEALLVQVGLHLAARLPYRAVATGQEALARYPGDPHLHRALAQAHLHAGQPDRTLEVLTALAELNLDCLSLCERALRALESAGQRHRALKLFLPLAKRLAASGHLTSVRLTLERVYPAFPDPALWLFLADLAKEARQEGVMRQALERALDQLDPASSLHGRVARILGRTVSVA